MGHYPHTANWKRSFSGSNFAPAFFFLPKQRRQALKLLYAVFRILDDAVDVPGDQDPRPFLAAWREVFETGESTALRGMPSEPLAQEFVSLMKAYDLPQKALIDFIDQGVSVDMNRSRFETPLDTEAYCYGVAGTVGLACLPIFGVPWREAEPYAVRLGVAVQWVNLIRDVGADARLDRIYLPQDHLEKTGCTEADVLAGRTTPAFLELMKLETQVARSHFERARELMPSTRRRELAPARIMGGIYLKLLEKCEMQNYPVFTRRVSLSWFEKGLATWNAIRDVR